MVAQNKRIVWILAGIALLLSLPYIAMQFTSEVQWSGTDFLVMGFMLLGLGLLVEIILRKVSKPSLRGLLLIGAVLIFLLVWVELAVGIIGTPFAGS